MGPMNRIPIIALLCILAPCIATAQDYVLQAGSPTFTTAWPVTLGFIDVSNGNLHLEIPLGTFPQRAGRTFTARLAYDSRIWQPVFNGTTTVWQPTNVANSQGGWRFIKSADPGQVTYGASGDLCDPGPGSWNAFGPFTWTAADGTSHLFNIQTQAVSGTLRDCGFRDIPSGSSQATDSSGYSMTVTSYTTATVTASDGTQVYPNLMDTNGNYFSTDGSGNIKDTLGRSPVTKTTNGSQTTYGVLNSQNARSNFVVTTQNISVSTSFSGGTEYSGTITVIQSVQLPDGTTYQFSYDSGTTPGHYGLLTGITLPTLGQVTFGHTNFTDAIGKINRWVSSYGTGGGTRSFTPQVLTPCPSGFTTCQQVTVTKPSSGPSSQAFTSLVFTSRDYLAYI